MNIIVVYDTEEEVSDAINIPINGDWIKKGYEFTVKPSKRFYENKKERKIKTMVIEW